MELQKKREKSLKPLIENWKLERILASAIVKSHIWALSGLIACQNNEEMGLKHGWTRRNFNVCSPMSILRIFLFDITSI